MLEDVEPVEVDPHVLVVFRVRVGTVQSEVREVQSAAHAQQVAHANLPARIPLLVPLLDRRKFIHVHLPALHDDADERRRDALAGRPADLRRVLRPAGAYRSPTILPRCTTTIARVLCSVCLNAPIERGIDAGVGLTAAAFASPSRPGLRGGVRKVSRNGDRLEMNVGFAARQDRAALIAVELRHARRDSRRREPSRSASHRRRCR